MNRRSILSAMLAIASVAALPRTGHATSLPKLSVYRNPGCGCCEEWVRYMQEAGFEVTIEDDSDLDGRRSRLGLPAELASCHIAVAGGYVFEGHIPPKDVLRFLQERPAGAIASSCRACR